MTKLYSRTSLTIDEAVANLLGWFEGPADFRPIGDDIPQAHEDDIASMAYCLHEALVEEYQDCQADLAEAILDNAPASRIAELQAMCSRYEQDIDLANRCRCAIEDELFKDGSAFTCDPNYSTESSPYITMASLTRWAKSNQNIREISGLVGMHFDVSPSAKMRDQEAAIVRTIERLGHDPGRLPKIVPGKPGVKKEVREALRSHYLFQGETVFDKAWERLRSGKEITDEL